MKITERLHMAPKIFHQRKSGIRTLLHLPSYAWTLRLFIYFNLGSHLDILRTYSWLFVKRSLQARLWVLYGYQVVNSVWPLARQRPYHCTYYLILCVVSSLIERFWIYKVDFPANWIDNSVPKCWKECPFMSLNECCKSKWWTWFYKWSFMTYLIPSSYSPQRTHHSVWARAYSLWYNNLFEHHYPLLLLNDTTYYFLLGCTFFDFRQGQGSVVKGPPPQPELTGWGLFPKGRKKTQGWLCLLSHEIIDGAREETGSFRKARPGVWARISMSTLPARASELSTSFKLKKQLGQYPWTLPEWKQPFSGAITDIELPPQWKSVLFLLFCKSNYVLKIDAKVIIDVDHNSTDITLCMGPSHWRWLGCLLPHGCHSQGLPGRTLTEVTLE